MYNNSAFGKSDSFDDGFLIGADSGSVDEESFGKLDLILRGWSTKDDGGYPPIL